LSNKSSLKNNNLVLFSKKININNLIKTKTSNFLKLIRYKSILPTLLLNLSGGIIMNPSILTLVTNQNFIVSTICTLLIMSNSMILNDLNDIEIDKINNPTRVLVTGEIKKNEAIFIIFGLFGLTEFLNINYLSENLQLIINLAITIILIYTPILKKILIIKNIACAFLVSFAVFVGGISATNSVISTNPNFNLLSIIQSVIFYGSLCNEIILDIRDYEGDKINNIKTIPVVFGKKFAWVVTMITIYLNIISNSSSLIFLYNIETGYFLVLLFIPLLTNLYKIKINTFSEESIIFYMKESTKSLFFILLYFCIIGIITRS
jgi:geranylgeranylglycerol-phosphate geranylgeranyltransferase